MEDLKDKSNNELLMEVKQLQADHEAKKLMLIKGYDELLEIEKRFNNINQLLQKRLKGEIK